MDQVSIYTVVKMQSNRRSKREMRPNKTTPYGSVKLPPSLFNLYVIYTWRAH